MKTNEIYLFLKGGKVQFYVSPEHGQLMLFATSHNAAIKAVKGQAILKGCSAALVGSVEGETLEGQLEAAMDSGAVGIMGTDDGEKWNVRLF